MPRKKIEKRVAIQRDESGLITQPKVDYVFNEDGTVNWRKMVKEEFLVPNKQRTKETDVSKLEDNQLIILLGGIKELAQIRGYTNVEYTVTSPSPDYVAATCCISWIPNYETEDKAVTFSAIGDASPNNTQNFAKFFLGPIAENRSFVRCVRNFLKINIVGKEELPGDSFPPRQGDGVEIPDPAVLSPPYNLLEAAMKSKNVTLKNIKKRLSDEGYEKAINDLEDIPKVKVFELIERIKKIPA